MKKRIEPYATEYEYDNLGQVVAVNEYSQGSLTAAGSIYYGISAWDDATGEGYILYSAESVFTRFADHPPLHQNSQHMVAVIYVGDQWYYSDDSTAS